MTGSWNSTADECNSERQIFLSSAFPPVKRVRTWRICSLQPTGDVLVKFGDGGQCSSLIGRYSSRASGPVSSVSGRNPCVRSLHGCVLPIACFHSFPICDTCCEALTTSGRSHLGSVLPTLQMVAETIHAHICGVHVSFVQSSRTLYSSAPPRLNGIASSASVLRTRRLWGGEQDTSTSTSNGNPFQLGKSDFCVIIP